MSLIENLNFLSYVLRQISDVDIAPDDFRVVSKAKLPQDSLLATNKVRQILNHLTENTLDLDMMYGPDLLFLLFYLIFVKNLIYKKLLSHQDFIKFLTQHGLDSLPNFKKLSCQPENPLLKSETQKLPPNQMLTLYRNFQNQNKIYYNFLVSRQKILGQVLKKFKGSKFIACLGYSLYWRLGIKKLGS